MPYLLLLFLLTSFCAKQEAPKPQTTIQQAPIRQTTSKIETIEDYDTMDNLYDNNVISLSDEDFIKKVQELVDFDSNDKITLDSPKRFLQISILFTLSQHSNYFVISTNTNTTDDKINDYMNIQRENFYKRLGITEEAYINYGIRHSSDIEEFLSSNIQFAETYEIIQSQVFDGY